MEKWSVMMGLMIMIMIMVLLRIIGRLGLILYGKMKMQSIKSCEVRVPKGSCGWPFIGETLEFIASAYTSKPASFMHKRKSLNWNFLGIILTCLRGYKYGKVFKTNLLGKPVIVSTDPEINKIILHNPGNIFVPSYPKSLAELFGETSILRLNGVAHKRLHGTIGKFLKSPEFKAQITRDIQNSVKLSLQNWKNKQLVYVQNETNQITFEILVKVLTSLEPGEEMEMVKKEYKEFIRGLISLPIKLPGTQLYKSLKAKERLQKRIRKMIEKRLVEYKREEIRGEGDAIDAMLSDMNDNNENDHSEARLEVIAGHIIEFMVPGEESVPMLMTLAVKYLSDNPVVLKLLVEENMDLKRQKTNSGSSYAWTDYMSLTFTQNVISETLRISNVVNAIWRKATKDVEIKGYLIPEGWGVVASFTSIHMDEQNYEDPYNFDPSRWDQKKGVVACSNTFTPFGGGQRLCPGLEFARLEVSIFLHHLVTTYRWTAENDEIIHFPTVKTKQKLPISIFPLED